MPTLEQARNWYSEFDPVHGFDHVERVYRLAERLAREEGADLEIVRAAVLLHDAVENPNRPKRGAPAHRGTGQKAAGQASRMNHHQASAEFAGRTLRREGWPEERIAAVQHCILAHRFRDDSVQPQTLEAKILFDADKLDAIGATGAARAIAYSAQEGCPAYSTPSDSFLETGQMVDGEIFSAYHEHLFKLRKLKDRLHTLSARRLAEERHRWMAEFFVRLELEAKGKA